MRKSFSGIDNFRDRVEAVSGGKDNLLWPYGFDEKHASSPSVVEAWKLLSKVERLLISRFNPSRVSRDMALRTLNKDLNLDQIILVHLSGLSRSTVSRILAKCDIQ